MSNRSKYSGFSLIEILVAGVLLATGSVLIIQSITSSIAAASHVHQHADAIRTAENQLVLFANGHQSSIQGTETTNRFTYDWTITTKSDSLNITRATCTVRWINRTRSYKFTLERLLPNQEESP